MPELPEVELVARSLEKLVAGRRVVVAELLRQRLAPENPAEEFAARLKNLNIESVGRRGKHILFRFERGQTLIAHLRMSGRFLLLPVERELPKHTHAVFYLDTEQRLVFSDQRHFGMMKIVETSDLAATKELACLAPEPLSEEFTFRYLRETFALTNRAVKTVLLDQTKVCGLGNIYAAEALFTSRINPNISANLIGSRRVGVLRRAIQMVLSDSIAKGSTMNVDPENIDGSYYEGGYERHWQVYDREGELCSNCGGEIKRIVQGARSTFYCPRCQRR